MPVYAGNGKAQLIHANSEVYLFKNENIAAGTASLAFLLDRITRDSFGFAVEIHFASDPGAFQFDVEGAEEDNDAYYMTIGSPITLVNAGFAARFSGVQVFPKFVRGKVTLLSASTNLTAVLSR